MWWAVLGVLIAIGEVFAWHRWGPRHEPPRDDLTVLGNLNSSSRSEQSRDTR